METTHREVVGPDGRARRGSSAASASRLHDRRRRDRAAASRSSSTRCRRARWPRRCTGTRARTSTATCSRGAWARCSATRSSIAEPGDLVFKPRNQWHTFWNAGDEPARILEIIAPAGFERFFRELAALGGAAEAAPEQLAELSERYGLEMQPESVPGLVERFGVRMAERAEVV